MRHNVRQFITIFIIALLLGLSGSGCVYYNSFYNAKQSFKAAENFRKKNGQVNQSDYQKAIEKALKVAENHPSSKYYDDAVYVLGVSYFHTRQYSKAERRFRELISNYEGTDMAKEALLYLAKCRMELKEYASAMEAFDEVLKGDYDKEFRAEAATELGNYLVAQKDYPKAMYYFQAVKDSLGNEEQKKLALRQIADAQFVGFRFEEALSSYLALQDMKLDQKQEYHALFSAAMCSYRLQRIKEGQKYLQRLADEPLNYDSLGSIQLAMGQGYEYSGDLLEAERIYTDVANSSQNKFAECKAYYRLGLIYQYDYDDLKEAKKFYDKSYGAGPSLEEGREAIQHSSDIGKLETFAKATVLDTAATEEDFERAALTHQALAELYWLQLNKPDSAIEELRYLLATYPYTKVAPAAQISLAAMYRDHLGDTAKADSLIRAIPEAYPKSDYIPTALEILGLLDTPADTGYAKRYIKIAENFLIDSSNIDSARIYYQYVLDNYPESQYADQARFSLIYLTELYQSPGDSSIVFAYQQYADSFPDSHFAVEAKNRLEFSSRAIRREEQRRQQADEEREYAEQAEVTNTDELVPGEPPDPGSFGDSAINPLSPLEAAYVGPNKERLVLLDIKPIEITEPFEYPASAYSEQQREFQLYFQIFLDFSGRVIDFVLKVPSGNDEIDSRAGTTIKSMQFNPLDVSREYDRKLGEEGQPQNVDDQGRWYVYKYVVTKPDFIE